MDLSQTELAEKMGVSYPRVKSSFTGSEESSRIRHFVSRNFSAWRHSSGSIFNLYGISTMPPTPLLQRRYARSSA